MPIRETGPICWKQRNNHETLPCFRNAIVTAMSSREGAQGGGHVFRGWQGRLVAVAEAELREEMEK